MPGMICAVFGCSNNWQSAREKKIPIFFHAFSKKNDFVSRTVREEWIRRCKRADSWNPDTSRICSAHFSENDYERDMQNELLGLPLRRILKKTAIPTLNLPGPEMKMPKIVTNVIDSVKDTNLKFTVESSDLQLSTSNKMRCGSALALALDSQASTSDLKASTSDLQASTSTDNIQMKYDKLLREFNTLKQEYAELQKSSKMKIKLLNNNLNYYKKKCLRQRNQSNFSLSVRGILKHVFTDNQISLLLKRKKRVNWTHDEVSTAFTLRYYSKKCYLFMRHQLHYPLPGLSSFRRWASKINMREGLLKNVLSFFKLAGEDKSNFEKTVVISYDEVKVKSLLEYDVSSDEIVGPYNQMQVVMARGLFSKWKQPIYIGFDRKMTKEILLNLISELYHVSYNVVACVSDCGGGNVGLWSELGVDINNSFFKHPNTENHIYMFADAPHLLKLLRNWLIDTGFDIGNISINKTPIEILLESTNQELSVCYKVHQIHLECEKTQRQNVRLAAELISNTVGEALIRYKPGPDKKLAENVGLFICDMKKWFDIFNSYMKDGKVPFKCAYGVHRKMQEEHLDKVLQMIQMMRAHGKNSLQTFQKGMIISIKSLKLLFSDMNTEFQIAYLCTHKLNQDCLENFFFQLRSRGPNDHPSPLIAMQRIRMIILGKNPGILEAHVNTEEPVLEEYISASVMKQAEIKIQEAEPACESSFQSDSMSSSDSSNKSSAMCEQSQEINSDALEYIAGYLAKKFRKNMPNLGQYTYMIKVEHNYNLPSWVQQLSYGGLIKPDGAFFEKIKKWNRYFQKFHGDSHRKETGIVKNLAAKIKKCDDFPIDIITAFCKLRTTIRINYLNAKNEEKKIQKKRKATETDSQAQRRKIKKINKLTN